MCAVEDPHLAFTVRGQIVGKDHRQSCAVKRQNPLGTSEIGSFNHPKSERFRKVKKGIGITERFKNRVGILFLFRIACDNTVNQSIAEHTGMLYPVTECLSKLPVFRMTQNTGTQGITVILNQLGREYNKSARCIAVKGTEPRI